MIVDWKESARQRLADLYVAAALEDREPLVRAVVAIEARLAAGPWGLGESREDDNHRVWFADLLLVGFWMVRGRPEVVVTHVQRLQPRRGDANGD